MVRLEHVRADAGAYPTHLLEGCATGLLLFGAAFQGRNDAIHFLDAGLTCDVVDIDYPKLKEMQEIYPAWWGFITADAWDFATQPRRYDAVSVDCWTGSVSDKVLNHLPLWCSLAEKFLTVTIDRGSSRWPIPLGWKASIMHRSSRASWLVLER